MIVLKLIKKYLETRVGKYAFYFQDLESGYVYGFNEDDKMTAAGWMKMCIAIAFPRFPAPIIMVLKCLSTPKILPISL